MRNVIVYAHPNSKSLNAKILDKTIEAMKDIEENYQLIDLYADDFDPRLIFNEEKKRKNLYLEEDGKKYRELIGEADNIIFIYPVWWNDMPAILKGFIDKIFAAEFAYRFKGIFQEGLLRGKKVLIINTMDEPKFYVKFFMRESHFKNFKKNILNFCGIKKVEKFTFFGVKNTKAKEFESGFDKMQLFIKKSIRNR